MFKGKKILVLGGAFQHCKVVEAAHELGMIVYVTDYLKDSPAKKIADVSLMFDVKDVDNIVNYCKKNDINAVINTSLDPCQMPYQEICEKLNLPCYGNREQFEILTNKKLFKECCNKYGVDTIESYDWDDLRYNRNIKYPIIIKDPCNRGSRGQCVCYDLDDVRRWLKKNEKRNNMQELVIEQYIEDGIDFTVAYIFVNGTAYLVRTGDRYLGDARLNLDRVAIAVNCPSKYTDMYLKFVHNKVIKMFQGIGIFNGPVFMQGIIDGNKVRFYDPGFRFSGGEYERVIKNKVGLDLINMLVKFAISGNLDENYIKQKVQDIMNCNILQLCPTLYSGKIQKIIGVEKIKSLNNIVSYFDRYKIGDIVTGGNDVSRRFAEICISYRSKQDLNVIYKIFDILKVIDINGNDMFCNRFDINRL